MDIVIANGSTPILAQAILDGDDDDLKASLKSAFLEKFRDWNVDDSHWYQFNLQNWKERLQAMGFQDADISFRGFWSQGDGASFTCTTVDMEAFIRHHKLGNRYRKLLNEAKEGRLTGKVERTCNFYCHEKTVSASLTYEPRSEELDSAAIQAGDNASKSMWSSDWYAGYSGYYRDQGFPYHDLEKFLEQEVVRLSKAIYASLEADHEHLTEDETVWESLLANDLPERTYVLH